jgi:glycosyltransferase involved in cell wall biosynthesis
MSNPNPRLSLGMPVYNGEQFLKETLDSILNQTFEDFELIISDNASTDNTEEICREYAAKDRRIRYYRNQQNLGAAPNYNRVFQLSKGDYFKWTAHDDLLVSEYLERCVEVLDRMPSFVLCYPRVVFIDREGKEIRKSSSNLLQLSSPRPHERFKQYQELFFHKSCFRNKASRSEDNKIPTEQIELDSKIAKQHPGGDRWLPIFGVIRSSVLKTTPLIASYVNSDAILLGELALLGKFYEVPEYLFLYRDYPQASGRRHNGYYEYNVWFDPANRDKIVVPLWRWFVEYLISIQRVQLNCYEKILCYAQMGRWFLWMWQRLAKELFITFLRVLNINEVSLGRLKKKLPTQW